MAETANEMQANDNAGVDTSEKMDCTTEITVTTEEDPTIEIDNSATVNTTDEVDATANVDATAEIDATANVDTTDEVDATADVDATAEVNATVDVNATAKEGATADVDTRDEVDTTADVNAMDHVDAVMNNGNEAEFIREEVDFIDMNPAEGLTAAVAFANAVDDYIDNMDNNVDDVNRMNDSIELMSVSEAVNMNLCTCGVTDDLLIIPDVIEIDPNKIDDIDSDDASKVDDDDVDYDSQCEYVEDGDYDSQCEYVEEADIATQTGDSESVDGTDNVETADDGGKLEDEKEDEGPADERSANDDQTEEPEPEDSLIKITESGKVLPISKEDMANIVKKLHRQYKKVQKEMCANCVKQSVTKIQTTIKVSGTDKAYKMQMYLFDVDNSAFEGIPVVPSKYLN